MIVISDIMDFVVSVEEKKIVDVEITSSNTVKFLDNAVKNLTAMGIDVPLISVELEDNPMIQCAREDTDYEHTN